MTTTHMFRSAAAFALVTLAAACGSDTVTSPVFGAACNVGSIAPGQTKYGALTAESCTIPYDFWSGDRVPYESRTVQLTAGKAYLFYEAQIPDSANGDQNDVDAVLTLWGKNADGAVVPLAASDDEADGIDGHDSQIWFVAPVSGTYQLVTASYWDAGYGGYRLEAHECPVLATLDTAGTYNLTLGNTSPCQRIGPANTAADTSRFSMIKIPVEPGEAVGVTVSSAAFVPDWEMFGPGFDTYANIYSTSEADYAHGTGTSGGVTMSEIGGVVTLAVGGDVVTASGAFTVVLTRTPPAAPPVGAAPWSIGRIALSPMRERPAKTR